MKNPDGSEKSETETVKDKEKAKEEVSGSASYVPKEPEKDTQLQYALSFLRGTAKEPPAASTATPSTPSPGAATEPAASSEQDKKPSPN